MESLCQKIESEPIQFTEDERQEQIALANKLINEILPKCKNNISKAVEITAIELFGEEAYNARGLC